MASDQVHPTDLVFTIVREYLENAVDLAKLSCVDRQRRHDAIVGAAEVTVLKRDHVDGAIRLAGARLRKLTLNMKGWTLAQCTPGLEGIDALAVGTVRVDVIDDPERPERVDGVIEDPVRLNRFMLTLFQWTDRMLANPVVRELRSSYFKVWGADSVAYLRNPKLVITTTLAIFDLDVGGEDIAADVLRHAEVSTLRFFNCANVPPALLAGTRARRIEWVGMQPDPLTPEQATAIGCNHGVRELRFVFDNENEHETLGLARLLRHPHDYSDGIHVSYEYTSNTVYEANPAVGRALAEAFASPALRVGSHLEIDTMFAISSEAVPDDELLAAIAACASRNEALRRLVVQIDGVPLPGNGARALLRLPEHVADVSVSVYEEQRMAHAPGSDVRRDNRWLWDALNGIDLPGATALSLSIYHGLSERSEPAVFKAAGIALARGVPRLIDLDVRFAQEDEENEMWIEPFCEGLMEGGLSHQGTFVKRDLQTVTWKKNSTSP